MWRPPCGVAGRQRCRVPTELANKAAIDVFGYDAAQLIDLGIDTLLPASRREAHRAHRAAYAAFPGTRPMGLGLDLGPGLRTVRSFR